MKSFCIKRLYTLRVYYLKFHMDHTIVRQEYWGKVANQLYLWCKEFVIWYDVCPYDTQTKK